MSISVAKWISLLLLLAGSVFARFAGNYEVVLNLLICAGALAAFQRAVCVREYLWAAAFIDVAIVFSPLTLLIKVFALLTFTAIEALGGVYAGWKLQPVRTL